ncbi:unnamed protein product [Spirodela intermedia]|uniref:Uncharacterized protein n=2 Tax=Spirodela intermedia TaxID=51605 RepID=A0ABN7EBZ3_SPIIN|nr:unnamed protein product [Spirodela intermedia]CAA7396086.1 unnamed protein product [Spirodela intermedia]
MYQNFKCFERLLCTVYDLEGSLWIKTT